MLIEIILGIIVLVTSILLIIVIYKEKFELYSIKIDEAENNVDMLLQKKIDLLNKTIPIMNKSLKNADFLSEVKGIKVKNFSHFELFDLLRKFYNELFNTLEENEKILKNKKLAAILDELNSNEEELLAAIKFYNDSVVYYNELINKFPSNIIRLLFGYKEKKFYKNEKSEKFAILKEKTSD